MSWLFGRKKQQKDFPTDSTEEEQTSDQSEQFVHVPRWPKAISTNTTHDTAGYPSGNLYPFVPPTPEFRQILPTDSSKEFYQGENTHYLNGVPFKLCKRLENSMNSDFEIDKLRISEILSFIQRIENENYDYSFSLEEGVVAEMNSRSDE